MTTIAWDGHTLAGDRLADCDGLSMTITKIRRLPDGRLLGFAGTICAASPLMDWIANPVGPRPEIKPDDDVTIIEIGPRRRITLHEGDGSYVLENDFAAIGNGRDLAIAAMALGKNAFEAVELAARFNIYTGRGVDVLALHVPRPPEPADVAPAAPTAKRTR